MRLDILVRKINGANYLYSPSDLTTFMKSPFASWMEHASKEDVALRLLKDEGDALNKSLQQKGYDHEERFYQSLISDGSKSYINIAEQVGAKNDQQSLEATIEAMVQGVEVIFQGCLEIENFRGFSDFLIKVPGKSDLGDYHYEVWDTKLSKSIKPYFLIQLSCYAEMLEKIQGVRPHNVVVVLGTDEKVAFKVDDYFYAYLALKERFLAMHESFELESAFDPADSKEWGDWSGYATQILTDRDHLIQVANINRGQIIKLNSVGIQTVEELASSTLITISKMKPEIFAKLKAQAGIQLKTKQLQLSGVEQPAFEVLNPESVPPKGLALLPPSSSMDVFFDIEGDPLHDKGLEYLWGATYFNDSGERDFIDFWAHNHEEEKHAFKGFIEWAYARWQADSSMHIYHYANYEIAACRRLMGRYGVCEMEVDALLRNEVFVDLYAIVRHGILLGEPKYSIKNVEHIYRGKRDTDVASGGESVVVYEAWRDNPDGLTWQTSKVLKDIRDYNQDDCDSTQELVDWLRPLQAEHDIAYLGKTPEEPKQIDAEKLEREAERLAVHEALLGRSVTLKPSNPSEAKICELLAHLLFFHEREAKPVWWKMFDRLSQDESELFDDIDCIANAQRTSTKSFKQKPNDRNLCFEYQIDLEQEFKLPRIGSSGKKFYLLSADKVKLNMVKFDMESGRFLIKAKDSPGEMISLIPDDYVNPKPIPEAVLALAEAYLKDPLQPNAFLDFLRRDTSRSQTALLEIAKTENSETRLKAIVTLLIEMDNGFLAIQGPPGTGKSYTAKHLIVALIMAGMRIGISSNSHKAIFNLMESIAKYAAEIGIVIPMYHTNERDADKGEELGIEMIKNNKISDELCGTSDGIIIGTTAWGFAREDLSDRFDYLFVDEAGQVSLANLAAMSQATNNLILLGDQMQLGQPIQGSHPGESGESVLEYLLGDFHTIPNELGVFLGVTYRMHPDVNSFVSQAFYDNRLSSAPQCAIQKVIFNTPHPKITKSTGLVYVPVVHKGNSQASIEEAEEIKRLKDDLIGQSFIDQEGCERAITLNDILFIAPYNHQVSTLKRLLGEKAKVGSVDLFQGQEAPIVILSMCSSDASESLRGVDFLLNPNRLNVAISRAQALAIVVASPSLVEMDLTSDEHIKLVNNFELLKLYSRADKLIVV